MTVPLPPVFWEAGPVPLPGPFLFENRRRNMEDLKIVYLDPHDLTPYEGNARKHSTEDVEQIKKSIELDGFNDPIGIWGDNNLIVEGHGRQLAAIQLGMKSVPCIRLDHLTDAQRRDYAIRHNRTAELSLWGDSLESELDRLLQEGFDTAELFDIPIGEDENPAGGEENPYTKVVNIPQYDPNEGADLEDCYDTEKTDKLIEEIESADISDEEKKFLTEAAHRHTVFTYKKIADYYAGASKEVQKLMERSALVIIDVDDAIAHGYAVLRDSIEEDVFGGEE